MQEVSPQDTVGALEQLCQLALVEDCGLSQDQATQRLDSELAYYRNLDLARLSMSQVFERFAVSLSNRQSLYTLVFGGDRNFGVTMERYRSVLHGWCPREIVKDYGVDDERLLRAILGARQLRPEQAEWQMTRQRSQLRRYAKGLLAGALYFSRFDQPYEFAEFIGKWLHDPDMAAMLPQYFAALGLDGFGAALAADFLKEIGVKQLGKPDVWVYRCMEAAGWIRTGASEFDVQRAFWKAAEVLGPDYPSVIIDKLMFLMGAGRYVMVEPQYKCKSRFEEFRRQVGDAG
jgi:hypothetical protein